MGSTGLSEPDFEVAVEELERKSLVRAVRSIGSPPFGYRWVESTEHTFVELDPIFMDWNPHEDALRIATELMNASGHHLLVSETAERLKLPPRRINPALTYLIQQDAVMKSNNINPTFVTGHIQKNNRTLAFIRERS
jgi:hypothetical protein